MSVLLENFRTVPSSRMRRDSSGFTLLEIMVVVLITAILAGAASLALLHRAAQSSLEDIIRRVEYLDNITRHAVRRSGHAENIVIDLDHGKIVTEEQLTESGQVQPSSDQNSNWIQQVSVASGTRFAKAWLMGADEVGLESGIVTIPCSADGYTPTYAVAVSGSNGSQRYMIFAGLTGQVAEVSDEKQVESAFKAIASPGDQTIKTQ